MIIDTTKMSSRGQVVIPLDMREGIREGDKLIVIRKDDDIIVAQITGESYEDDVEISLNKEDFKQGSLKRESYIRIDKIASIEKYLIKYKAGSLKQEKFSEVINQICS